MPPTILLATLLLANPLPAQATPGGTRTDWSQDLLEPLETDLEHFRYSVDAWTKEGGQPNEKAPPIARLWFARHDAQSFELHVDSPWAEIILERTAERTTLYLPEHRVRLVGSGSLPTGDDTLAPRGFLRRLAGSASPLLPLGVAALRAATAEAETGPLRLGESVQLHADRGKIRVTMVAAATRDDSIRRVEITPGKQPLLAKADLREHPVSREELERVVFRALRRALTLAFPEELGVRRARPRKTENGELRRVGSQDLAILHGSPEQIGRAHARLLGPQVRLTIDSTVYLVGLLETVRTGDWFPDVLAKAWTRLSPHIPQRHQRELRALADALPDVSLRELRLGNVFPEYFHCSGFAVFGAATVDGVLYHGRVLDYMTEIGLQHAAVAQIVVPDQGHAFFSAGYAGFVGVVSGMNERQISLGEMGGGGRFQWDGVPMATLMRRALEECETLDQVCTLWRDSPRTCEYYYVFADGKGPSAVAVKATPAAIEFLHPGEDHDQLGKGIRDAVVISAGDRLTKLRERIEGKHGRIDATIARDLMARPVAMRSNLHNVLFVPQQGKAFVAQAGQDLPAAERSYESYDVTALLAQARAAPDRELPARDTLRRDRDESPAARAMLDRLTWPPGDFTVRVTAADGDGDQLVWFPSPTTDRSGNENAVLEWYEARGTGDAKRPAVVVLHILDGRMRIARRIAANFAEHGVHGFVLHLPDYGKRGDPRRRKDARTIVPRFLQGARDARRARDAIAALPGVDSDHIALQGTSLGGFVGALAATIDGGFDATFLLLAGGDFATMIRDGGQDTAKIRRKIRAAGYTDEEVAELARAIDPARLAHRMDAQRTWLYSASFDEVVPARNAAALGRAAGLDPEHHRWFPCGHYTAILFLPQVFEHMLGELGASTAPRRR